MHLATDLKGHHVDARAIGTTVTDSPRKLQDLHAKRVVVHRLQVDASSHRECRQFRSIQEDFGIRQLPGMHASYRSIDREEAASALEAHGRGASLCVGSKVQPSEAVRRRNEVTRDG